MNTARPAPRAQRRATPGPTLRLPKRSFRCITVHKHRHLLRKLAMRAILYQRRKCAQRKPRVQRGAKARRTGLEVSNHRIDSPIKAPVGDLAARTGVSIIGVMHLRKAPSDQAMFRVIGSVAFTAYARACWLIGEDHEEPGSKLMLPVKLNVAKAAPGLRFQIVEPGKIVWFDEPVDATAEDMFAARAEHPDEAGPKVVAAAEWLEQALGNGAQCAKELKKQASENCMTPRTVDRAKARLGAVASNEGVFGQAWYWTLPEPKPPLRERCS